jgi:hypothetical protein
MTIAASGHCKINTRTGRRDAHQGIDVQVEVFDRDPALLVRPQSAMAKNATTAITIPGQIG